MSGSPLDRPIIAPLVVGPGPSSLRGDMPLEIERPALRLRLKPWSEPPNLVDTILSKLDKLEDAMTQILDFLTTPTAVIVEPTRQPLSSALTANQRRYLRYWARDGMTLQEIAAGLGVSSSSVQRSLAAAAKKMGYLTTAEMRNAVSSGALSLE